MFLLDAAYLAAGSTWKEVIVAPRTDKEAGRDAEFGDAKRFGQDPTSAMVRRQHRV